MAETSYTHARAHFAELCDQVTSDREPVIIRRRGAEDVALISADELRSMEETLYLLSSPENGIRLLTALRRAAAHTEPVTNVKALREELGLYDEEQPRGARRRPAS